MEPGQTSPRMPKIREGVSAVEIDGEAVIFVQHGAQLHHLNPAAAIVYSLCDGTGTVADLAADIAEAFGAPPDQVEREVQAVVDTFDEIGILETGEMGGSVG